MPLSPPNLDDRTFEQLLAEAKRQVTQTCPAWTDLSPHDPGVVLLEVFAYLTEQMIYRLNRLPEKAYVEFLRLIGVRIQPPMAASVTLLFSREVADQRRIDIPRGTRVTTARADAGTQAPVFVTTSSVSIEAGKTEASVLGYHCEVVDAEQARETSKRPTLSVRVLRPPIIAPTGDALDLVVGVEVAAGELAEGAPAREYDGKTYQIWREVDDFTGTGPEDQVYVVDRMTGTITFAPAAQLTGKDGQLDPTPRPLAKVPAAGREIRLWYRRGGGPEGNVAAQTLTTLKDPVPGVKVTNPSAATGGRAAETLENALVRGPQELHSLRRAVTARDFESLAMSQGAVSRARAFTQADLWEHAAAGTVEIALVPNLPEAARVPGQVTPDKLSEYETDAARAQIQTVLDERRALGTKCVVKWTRCKTARVAAQVVAHRAEDQDALRARMLDRLYESINPFHWQFGQPLRASHVYDLLSEPGVNYIAQVRLITDEVPGAGVTCVAADRFQRKTFYAASGATLFRTMNDGDGWEAVGQFSGETIDLVIVHPDRAGLLAVSSRLPEGATRLRLSHDCGETWEPAPQPAFAVLDMAWMVREGVSVLLLATEKGLFELVVRPGAVLDQIRVDPSKQDLALYAVAVATSTHGDVSVAVAVQNLGGILLSDKGGASNTFRSIGLDGQDVRVLALQQYPGNRSFLWAGLFAGPGTDEGKGCYRWELWPGEEAAGEEWSGFGKNWKGGGCRWLAFAGAKVLAATHRAGVLWLDDGGKKDAAWNAPEIGCGLPLRGTEEGRIFQPVDSVTADSAGNVILAGGSKGVYRSRDGGRNYLSSSKNEFTEFSDKVTLPETWLFCSGVHDIQVVSEDEAERD